MNNLLTKLRKLKIEIRLTDGRLKVNGPKGVITQEILNEIKKNQGYLKEYISSSRNLEFNSIEKAPTQSYYKLSSAQRRQYFLHEFDKSSTAYNSTHLVRLIGDLDMKLVEGIFNKLIYRHEILRTFFEIFHNHPMQRVSSKCDFKINYIYSTMQEVDSVIEQFVKPFDLGVPPLLRVILIQLNCQDHILLVDMHHIITDGVSHAILIKEFLELYNNIELPPLALQYKDYAEWQQSAEQQAKRVKHKEFWLQEYSTEANRLDLPIDFPRPHFQSYEGDSQGFELSLEEYRILKSITKEEGVTMFIILLSFLNILLSKLSNQEDIVVGVPVADRHHVDFEKMIGMFVNTLALRNFPKGGISFKDFLSEVKSHTFACLDNQSFPYEELIDELEVYRETSRNPLFDVMLVLQNTELVELTLPGLIVKPYNREKRVSKFDLSLIATESDERIFLNFEYSTRLFKKETIERFIVYFKRIVSTVTADINEKISDIEILSGTEKKQLLYEFNNTKGAYPNDKTITEIFELQARNSPESIALRYGEEMLSYRELEEITAKIASYLSETGGVKVGDLVGVMLERESHLIPSIFGILKAGAGYVPIDPNYPTGRINSILDDSQLKVLITRGGYLRAGINIRSGIINLDKDLASINSHHGIQSQLKASSSNLAYVIYTSGSTGKPKGVMIEHHSVVNGIFWMQKEYPIYQEDVILQKTPIAFDVSVWELFWWSFTGASLCLLKSGGEKDPGEIITTIEKYRVTHIHFVPSMLQAFLSALNDGLHYDSLGSLEYVYSSGEVLKPEQVSLFGQTINKHCGTRLINLYGPTEATVHVSYFECKIDNEYTTVPIGRPISNIRLYILNRFSQLNPIGVAGELCIAGVGLARGYLHNASLTTRSFIDNPYEKGEKLYKTGDLAKWLPDGNIEFLGRLDDQVKIRGFRIELTEIEVHLNRHLNIRESVVLLREIEGDRYLVAYYVSEVELSVSELRDFLSAMLPEYMVPVYYVHLSALPLTPNGKVDRKALPEFKLTRASDYVGAQTVGEKLLVDIWEQVLGVSNIGITDNFFSLGGDSIKSIQISSRVREAGYELSVNDIFTNQTIQTLSLKLEEIMSVSEQSIVTGESSLSPIQRWFFKSLIVSPHHFNQSVMLNFSAGLSLYEARVIFEKIYAHHDALRMVFRRSGEFFVQQNNGLGSGISIEEIDLRGDEFPELKLMRLSNEIQSGIDLEDGPLVKLGLFHMRDGSRLLIVIHHLVVDGVSWRILFEDMETLYNQQKDNKRLLLPLKSDPFLSWSSQILSYMDSKAFHRGKEYWDTFSSNGVIRIPRDYSGGENRIKDSEVRSIRLSKGATTKLLTEVHTSFNTQINDILLTALLLSIKKHYGHCSVMVDLEGHGREEIQKGVNINRTVGWFTSIYPVLLEYVGSDLTEAIKHVKETLRRIPNNGFDYLIQKYFNLEDTKDGFRSQISFNYLGQFDVDTEGKSYTIAKEASGDNISMNEERVYDWGVSGIITGAQLEISLTYSKRQYKQETINAILSGYHEILAELIDYCCSYGKVELTPSDLTYKELTIPQVEELDHKYELEDIYTLSPMQEGMLFHSLLDAKAELYFEQVTLCLKGCLDIEVVEKSMNDLMVRHQVLRTIFLHEGYPRPIQVVLKERKIDFAYKDVRDECLHHSIEDVVGLYQLKDRSRLFNLSQDVLMRLMVLRTLEDGYVLIWSHHHVLMDGWCMGIIFNEFREIYIHNKTGRPVSLAPVHPYSNYISWLERRDKESSANYWKQYLGTYESLATLPQKGKLTTDSLPFDQRHHYLTIDSVQTNRLQEICKRHSVTVNTIFQGSWGILLSKYNNSEDVVFGSVVSGRPADIEGIETMVGLFINTVPVRVKLNAGVSVGSLLTEIQESALTNEPHHYHPLAEIQSMSELGRDLLNHIMIFVNYPLADKIEEKAPNLGQEDFAVTDVKMFDQTNYDLTIFVVPGEEIHIKIEYNAQVYDPEIIKSAAAHLNNIIDQINTDSKTLVSAIELLMEEEKHQLLFEFNNTKVGYPKEKTIQELFEQQVARTPKNIALIYEGISLTYQELNERSNQLAHYLRKTCAIKSDDRVGLMLDRSSSTLIGILGILKAGAAYVPIESSYPLGRKSFILSDSDVKVLVTDTRNMFSIYDGFRGTMLALDVQAEELLCFSKSNPIHINKSKDLAYIIYTSGSTGLPKGVMIVHRSLVNYVNFAAENYVREEKVSFPLYTSISFDLTITSIFTPLITGNKILVYEEDEKSSLIEKVISDGEADVIKLTPSHLRMIRDSEILKVSKTDTIKRLIVGGEELETQLVKDIYDQYEGRVDIYNEYGPTEATVGCMIYKYDPKDDVSLTVPIGVPINNTQIYILDRFLKPAPRGVNGEIYVSGDGIANGYWLREDLTKQNFLPHPFIKGKKIYKTGDLGIRLSNAYIIFKGRIDNQVKLRGFRIELEDIESELNKNNQIRESVVLAKGTGSEKYLVAYYVSESKQEASELRNFLYERLPDYMIPSYFVHLESIPLNPNGKLNQKALPEPNMNVSKGYVAPSNEIEEKFIEIWSEILKIEKDQISLNSNFFELGGHSLSAIQLITKIQKEFLVKIELNMLFEYPSVEQLLTIIESDKVEKAITSIPKAEKRESYQASSAQERLFFEQMLNKENLAYNISSVYLIESELDINRIKRSFQLLIDRHESLRTYLVLEGNNILQRIKERVDFDLLIIDKQKYGNRTVKEVLNDFISPFDLSNCPLIRCGVLQHEDKGNLLFVDIHHIVCDGISLNILMNEFVNIYLGNKLKPIDIKYVDYAHWQKSQNKSLVLQKEFWMKQLRVEPSIINLPTIHSRDSVKIYNGKKRVCRINKEQSQKINRVAAQANVSNFMFMLSIYYILLSKLSGNNDIIVGTDAIGRTQADLKNIVGTFINVIPLRLLLNHQISFKEFLLDVKNCVLDALNNQDYQFDQMSSLINNGKRQRIIDLYFSYTNFFEMKPGLSGLQFIPKQVEKSVITTKYELELNVTEDKGQFILTFLYSTALYDSETIELFVMYYHNILLSILQDSMIAIEKIELEDSKNYLQQIN